MKRFWLFEYYGYYPSGGYNDLTGCFATLEEAVAAASREVGEEHEILDITTGETWSAFPSWTDGGAATYKSDDSVQLIAQSKAGDPNAENATLAENVK